MRLPPWIRATELGPNWKCEASNKSDPMENKLLRALPVSDYRLRSSTCFKVTDSAPQVSQMFRLFCLKTAQRSTILNRHFQHSQPPESKLLTEIGNSCRKKERRVFVETLSGPWRLTLPCLLVPWEQPALASPWQRHQAFSMALCGVEWGGMHEYLAIQP